jgi:alkylation response protein AidB-like acyl-CoA dehydrogenase
MDVAFSDEQRALYLETRKFAEAELNDRNVERDHTGEFNRAGWKKAAEFGIHGMVIPAEYGGGGADVLTALAGMEGFGYGCHDAGLVLAVSAHVVICMIPIWQFGSEAQKKKYLPGLCSGELIGAYGLTEPEAGSDAFSLRTTAVRKGDVYKLTGEKIFITNGPIADVLVVFATVDRSKGSHGVTAFLVEKNFPGFRVAKTQDKCGLRTSPTGELVFDECEVPVENRLGAEGDGPRVMHGCLEWERACLMGASIGMMEYQLDRTVEYAKTRRQFGKAIGEFQAISHRLADMKVRLETSRQMIYKVGAMKAKGLPAFTEASIAKLWVSECRLANAMDAVRIHGGYGYMREFEVERHLRDVIPGVIGAGSSEIQKNIIARQLLKD